MLFLNNKTILSFTAATILLARVAAADGLCEADPSKSAEPAVDARVANLDLLAAAAKSQQDYKPSVPEDRFIDLLDKFIDEHSCKAPDSCNVATSEEMARFKTEQMRLFPGRVEYVDVLSHKYSDAAERLKTMGEAYGGEGSNFQAFYGTAANNVLKNLNQREYPKWVMMISPNSPLFDEMDSVQAGLKTWRSKIDAATDPDTKRAYQSQMLLDYAAGMEKLREVGKPIKYIERKYNNEEMSFADYFIRHTGAAYPIQFQADASCHEVSSHDLPPSTNLFDGTPSEFDRSESQTSLSLFKDWKVFKAMLDGTDLQKGPMKFSCPQVTFSPKSKYDAASNSLVREWKNSYSFCAPGSCGDLGFHINKRPEPAYDDIALLRKTFNDPAGKPAYGQIQRLACSGLADAINLSKASTDPQSRSKSSEDPAAAVVRSGSAR